MVIPVPEGKSDLVYPSTISAQLSDYDDSLEIIFLIDPSNPGQAYVPHEPLASSFCTLDYELSYQIVATKAFEIVV